MRNIHIYPYTMHCAHGYNYIQYILSVKVDYHHLIRAKLKFAKYPISTSHSMLLLSLTILRAE